MAETQRVLIYRIGSLGDTVVALPALRLIAKSYPNSVRYALTNFTDHVKMAPMSAILENTGLVDGYIEYPIGLRNARAIMKLRGSIRRFKPDVLVYLAHPRGRWKVARDVAFFRFCGISRIVGIPDAVDCVAPREIRNGLYEYAGTRLVRCLKKVGDISLDSEDAYHLALTPEEWESADAVLRGAVASGRLLAICLGTKADTKDWGDDRWMDLLARLGRRLQGWTAVLIGSQDEYERGESVLRAWPGGAVNLCGLLTVRVSAAVLRKAEVYIGHDSGPTHLAAAVGTPCVAIFSARNLPGEWFPYGREHSVLYHSVPCRGCGLEVCGAHDKMCIRSISCEEVEERVLSVVTKRDSSEQRQVGEV